MSIHRATATLVCIAALAASDRQARAKDYAIKLSRPDKVGTKYRLNAREKKKQSMSISRGMTALKNEETNATVRLQAVVEILKVDKSGEPLKKKVTIEKFVDEQDDALLKPGTVVTAETVEGKTAYRMGGKELPDRAREFLSDIVKTKGRSSSNDDETFGSKIRRKVGETWKMNAAALAKDLKLKPQDVGGTVTLEAIEKHEGTQCLRIGIDIDVKKAPESKKLAEQGFAVGKAEIHMKLGGLVPVDPKLPGPAEWMRIKTTAEYQGSKPATKGFAIKMNLDIIVNATMTYLK